MAGGIKMSKVIVNDQEVTPAKKVKLWHHKSPKEIKELIKKKKQEQANEQLSSDQE